MKGNYNKSKMQKSIGKKATIYTDGCNILHTLLVKHYNDLLDRPSSELGRDEFTQFYVGDVFCIHRIHLCMPIFKKKSFRIFLGESSKLCIVVTLLQYKVSTVCPAENSVYQPSHCSALLIGCVKYCTRQYVPHIFIL